MTYRAIPLAVVLAVLAGSALAQQTMTFRLDKSDRNPSSCSGGDSAMSRPQNVTIEGDVAVIKSNGGINDRAKKAGEGIYRTRWTLGTVTYDIEINTAASPATISVAEPKLGCKWSGKAS